MFLGDFAAHSQFASFTLGSLSFHSITHSLFIPPGNAWASWPASSCPVQGQRENLFIGSTVCQPIQRGLHIFADVLHCNQCMFSLLGLHLGAISLLQKGRTVVAVSFRHFVNTAYLVPPEVLEYRNISRLLPESYRASSSFCLMEAMHTCS